MLLIGKIWGFPKVHPFPPGQAGIGGSLCWYDGY